MTTVWEDMSVVTKHLNVHQLILPVSWSISKYAGWCC